MTKGTKFLTCTLAFLFCVHLQAQHSTSSPYSMFGIGELDNKTYGMTGGMANAGIGLYNQGTLNLSNPASIAVDSLSFLFDLSTSGTLSQYSNVATKEQAVNFNIKKVAFGVRLIPKLSLSMGLLPYSNVQYRIFDEIYMEGGSGADKYEVFYTGTGGLSKMFLAGSYKLLPNLYLGANLSYLFGRINRSETMSQNTMKISSNIDKLIADFGLLYSKPLNTTLLMSAGLTYSYRTEVKMKNYRSNTMSGETTTQTSSYTSLPQSVGAGFSLQNTLRHSHRVFSVDYKFHNWNAIQSPDKRTHYTDSHRINAGVSYIHNYRTPRNYFQRIQYQAGAYFEKMNLIINGNGLTETGITAGMVFPLRNSYTQLFLSADLGRRGGQNLMHENFLRFNFGICMNQQWFTKWFYD